MLLRSTLRLLALALPLLLATGACKKSTDTVTARQCLLRSTTYSYSYNGTSYTDISVFEYNADKQLIKATYSNPKEVWNYTYLSSGLIVMTVTPAPSAPGTLSATYSRNSAGYITEIVTVNRVSGGTMNTEQRLEYNADGYLSKQTNSDGSYRTYEYSNGNKTVERYYNNSGGGATYTSTHYEDKTPANPLPGGSVISVFQASGLLGKLPKNPVKQTVTVSPNSNRTVDFIHTYDADGNINSSIQKSTPKSGTTDITTINYTYLCQ